MKPTVYFIILTIMVALFGLSPAYAAEVDIPNSFSAGDPAVADEVNANFDAIKTAVDDNDGRIEALEAALASLVAVVTDQTNTMTGLQAHNDSLSASLAALEDNAGTIATLQETITTLQAQVSTYAAQTDALQSENDTLSAALAALTGAVTAMEADDYALGITNLDDRLADVEANSVLGLDGVLTYATDLNGYPSARFSGVNVQIVDGTGSTYGATGTGNLIVGYNELRNDRDAVNNRTGSHNIVVGRLQNYSSFGGLVAGQYNSITGRFSSVTGGDFNTASGDYSSISGGEFNNAKGLVTSIAGGNVNTANYELSTISGGSDITDRCRFDLEPLFTHLYP